MKNLKKGKGLKNRALKKAKTYAFCCTFFDPHNLAKTCAWQKNDITIGSGVRKYAEWCIRIAKSSTDDPKTVIFYFFDVFLTEPGRGPKP